MSKVFNIVINRSESSNVFQIPDTYPMTLLSCIAEIPESFDTSELEDMSYFLGGVFKLNFEGEWVDVAIGCSQLKNVSLKTDSSISLRQTFIGCTNLESISLSDTSNVEDMSFMCGYVDISPTGINFLNESYCVSLKTISPLNLVKTKYADFAFLGCGSLETLTLNNTEALESISGICFRNESLKTISPLNLPNCKSLMWSFNNCTLLESIYLSNTGNVESMFETFSGCRNLKTIETLDFSSIRIEGDTPQNSGVFNNCESLENLDITNWTVAPIFLDESPLLTPLSVHKIISQAIGTESRRLILNTNAYVAWQASEYYTADLADATSKNITVEQAS